MPIFDDIHTWTDPQPHPGALNMAIDQLLLESVSVFPLLRLYQWQHPTISLGYFQPLDAAKRDFPDSDDSETPLHYIRRWTGGGIVDHRIDLTYTLIIPSSHPLSSLRGAESYRLIHLAVAAALRDQSIDCLLTPSEPCNPGTNSGTNSSSCFQNPVAFDIIDSTGKKLAGAGQKRSRHGLLHQGSVIAIKDKNKWQQDFQTHLTSRATPWHPSQELLENATLLSTQKYATHQWLTKR